VKYSLILLSFLFLFSFTYISCSRSSDGGSSNTSTTTDDDTITITITDDNSTTTDNTTTSPWTKQLGTSFGDGGSGVSTDSSGNFYVTGYTNGGLDGNTNYGSDCYSPPCSDIFLVKYNSDGVLQ
jgi:hypothetical protein